MSAVTGPAASSSSVGSAPYVLLAVIFVSIIVFSAIKVFPPSAERRRWIASVLGGFIAYGLYVQAALFAKVDLADFMRAHLFDGLAPGAAVALLARQLMSESPVPANWRPIYGVAAYFFGGAIIAGLIGTAAVFSSNAKDYGAAVLTAIFGGIDFAAVAAALTSPNDNVWPPSQWFRRPPQGQHYAAPERH
jgi:hypothetical protein